MQYTFRIGTISGTTFTSLASGSAIPGDSYTAGDWFTMTFDSSVTLSADTEYAIDIMHHNTLICGLGWRTAGEWTAPIPVAPRMSVDSMRNGSR